MGSPVGHPGIWRCSNKATLLAAIGLSAGCAPSLENHRAATRAIPTHAIAPPPNSIPVVRYARYTLIELGPDAAQQDLLQQVVDISIPGTMTATVGDALGYVLLRSGYQRCEAPDDSARLYALPLPAPHLHLGPMSLRDALQTLAGPRRPLPLDDSVRQPCL